MEAASSVLRAKRPSNVSSATQVLNCCERNSGESLSMLWKILTPIPRIAPASSQSSDRFDARMESQKNSTSSAASLSAGSKRIFSKRGRPITMQERCRKLQLRSITLARSGSSITSGISESRAAPSFFSNSEMAK